MSKLQIRIYGDPVLRKKAEDVTEFGDSLENLAADMVEIMLSDDGVGLAAPQVGLSKRFLVIGMPVNNDEDKKRIIAMANPEILEFGEETETMEEGCLSLPGLSEDVERPINIRVRYQDLKGETREIEAEYLLSRVIQHETDHLNGVLFIDHISALKRSLLRGKLKRLQEESAQVDNGS